MVVSTSFEGTEPVPLSGRLTVTLSAPVDAASVTSSTVALVRGDADAALVRAFERPPLSLRQLARLVAVELTVERAMVHLDPRRPLLPLSRYTLLLGPGFRAGGARIGRLIQRALVTGGLDRGAALQPEEMGGADAVSQDIEP